MLQDGVVRFYEGPERDLTEQSVSQRNDSLNPVPLFTNRKIIGKDVSSSMEILNQYHRWPNLEIKSPIGTSTR